jgi:hypothetical protein
MKVSAGHTKRAATANRMLRHLAKVGVDATLDFLPEPGSARLHVLDLDVVLYVGDGHVVFPCTTTHGFVPVSKRRQRYPRRTHPAFSRQEIVRMLALCAPEAAPSSAASVTLNDPRLRCPACGDPRMVGHFHHCWPAPATGAA